MQEIQASVADGIDFLVELHDKGHSYSSVNLARSALSSIMIIDNHLTFGCHPLVVRCVKAIYNLRPPLPRYVRTWDVNVVLVFLRRLSPVKELSFKMLTLKLATLMALITAHRVQTLHLLDLHMLKRGKFEYTFEINKVIKTSKPGRKLPTVVLKSYPVDRRLCIVTVLNEFLKRRAVKVQKKQSKLFCSYISPYGPVSKCSISRWIKEVLARAGIDTKIFKAHSVRGAVTSKAKDNDYPIEDILKAGGWAQAGTFAKFYDRSVQRNTFAETVLKM